MGTVTITITDEGPFTDRVSIAAVFDDGNGNGMSTIYASHVVAINMMGAAKQCGDVADEQCFGGEEGGEHGPH